MQFIHAIMQFILNSQLHCELKITKNSTFLPTRFTMKFLTHLKIINTTGEVISNIKFMPLTGLNTRLENFETVKANKICRKAKMESLGSNKKFYEGY